MSRRRSIRQFDAAVWCPGGRFGGRRVRVSECVTTLRAEDLYTALLADGDRLRVRPGARGTATYQIGERSLVANWNVRANAVWRCGRVFFECPRCAQPCTRLYLPLLHSWLACRTCWGLTYVSRALLNYKDSIWGRGPLAGLFGTSQRDWSVSTTSEARKKRREDSQTRWEQRRPTIAALPLPKRRLSQ